jgi:hypothetical protein
VKLPRLRIAGVMGFVAIVALNFGAIRALSGFAPDHSDYLTLGALPMADILVVGLLIAQQYPQSRPFFLGFEVFGAMALALYVALEIYCRDKAVNPYLALFFDPIERIGGRGWPVRFIPIRYSIGVAILVLPQIALALIGGFLSRRFRVTIIHR